MNKLFILCSSLLLLTSCASEYQIKGTSSVSRLDGKMLFVKVPVDETMVKVDSAEVIHGLFTMQGVVDSAMIASLYMDELSIMPLVIEKGHIQISIDNARSLVKGTPLNDRLYSFIQKKLSLDDRAYELERRESQMIMDGKSLEDIDIELTKERQKLSEELNTLAKSFILSNCDNILGPGVFRMICGGYDIPIVTPLIEDIMKEAPDNFKNHPMVKVYMEIAEQNLELMKQEMSR